MHPTVAVIAIAPGRVMPGAIISHPRRLDVAAARCSTAPMDERAAVAIELEQLFEELIVHQRRRVLEAARRLNPQLTEDDIQQPQDFPELAGDSAWNYEDGILAGFLAAQMAARARLRR